MRTLLLASVVMLGMTGGSAFAQLSNTLSPAAPNAASQGPQPTNSLPTGGPTANGTAAGANLGTAATAPAATAAAPRTTRRARVVRRRTTAPATSSDATPSDQSAPPTEAYRGGAGSPLSTQATDLRAAPGERMGSRLPTPASAGNDPHDLLVAAQRSLDRRQTGAAQQALEMAETRVLSRTTDPSMANQPDNAAMVQNIAQARQALGARDVAGAKQAIAAALQAPVPPPGPAVTVVPGTPSAPTVRTY